MNGIQNKKAQSIEKPFPGCLGRMVNLFDLSNGVTGNKLLTDKPHRDGTTLSRSRSDVARMINPAFGDQIEDKLIVSELRRSCSNKKENGTPMKTLIAQEMSKEVEPKHSPPNVVAKLMGLDSLPQQQPNSAAQRIHSKGYSRRSLSHSGIPTECWEQEHGFWDNQMLGEVHECREQNEFKDVYEIWQQSLKPNYERDNSLHKGGYKENMDEKKMALIRQKFMEAKRLATDERLRQSKEFQDAVDVLSSNRDLFLKVLAEPNSLYSQHLYDLRSTPSSETKRITVLKPTKVVDNEKFAVFGKKNDKLMKKSVHVGQAVWDKSSPGHSPTFRSQKVDEYPAQPTRIVVLKPSPGKSHDIKAVVSPPSSSPRKLHGEDFYNEPEDDEARESREMAKEITRQMRENLIGHRRDETLLSSVFSNGYVGDDSSFNKSENEYAVGNLSDSEVMSPTSRHSWDYINRFGSPYSCSSFSRASCSPESSVCREAKKRLSERWAMMASNGSSQEQKHVRRSSSTLGEMLALSDTKKSMRSEEEGSSNKEQEPKGSTSYLASNFNNEEAVGGSPKNLTRSRSVPVSSTAYGTRLNVEASDPDVGNSDVSKELAKVKSMKSSLKGKVSSLFFSRSKKSTKERSSTSHSATSSTPESPVHLSGKVCNDTSQCVNNSGVEDCSSSGLYGSSSKVSPNLTGVGVGQKKGIVSQEACLSVAKPFNPGNGIENQDQPSPISVLEPPFEEDDNLIPESSGNINAHLRGREASFKSNLIDKSPPIGSISRTLSWDDSYAEPATPYLVKQSSASPDAEEEQDWCFLVQTLLSAAGIDSQMQSDSFFARWHSPESPLDPLLRDKYANLNDKEPLHEAKRRQRRSNRKFIFDSVNAALVEISGYGSDRSTRAMSDSVAHNRLVGGASSLMLVNHVWGHMKEWFSCEVRYVSGDGGDSNSLVERVVGKEVVGKGWADNMRLELDNMGKEIEGNLLEELVEEAVVDLTGRI